MALPKKLLARKCKEDRISSLPDGVLCHILSFLTTKETVVTSVLSNRWNHLFTLVPNLDFEFNIFSVYSNSPAATSIPTTRFIRFVNSVLISYNVSRMNKFHFSFSNLGQTPEHFPIHSWISSVINRQVREIKFSDNLSLPHTLPRTLFSCKTLVTLDLHGSFCIALPSSVCLPCLRTCNFVCVKFDDESARMLFRNCPVLNHLDLKECDVGEGAYVLDISSNSLKNFSFWGSDGNYQVALNLPNLISFEFAGPVSNDFIGLDSLKSMVCGIVFYEPGMNSIDGGVLKLVRSYSHVQELGLNCDVMEAFMHSGHPLPKFNNLTGLTLTIAPISSAASKLIPHLLDNSPLLEFLDIYKGCGDDHNGVGESSYLLPEHVPACVSLRLEEVVFFFTGLDYERELIKYFLKYANNLKEMKIRSKLSWSEQCEISSVACQVVFDTDYIE